MLDVKKVLSKILNAPIIIEQGTSGIWTYRKWSDGTAEAWARNVSAGTSTPAVWASPIRYSDRTFTMPSGIFNSAPIIQATSGSSQYWINDAISTSATAANVRLCTLASSSQNWFINVNAIGTWK